MTDVPETIIKEIVAGMDSIDVDKLTTWGDLFDAYNKLFMLGLMNSILVNAKRRKKEQGDKE